MDNSRPPRVLISGGGTGGHIFPAVAIANILRERLNAEILFVGADNRMEMEKVPAAGYKIIGLPVAGFDRRHLLKNFSVLLKLRKSISMARKIVADFKPDIAIGVGGYASGPTLKAAQKAGVPTLLQEQNSYPGVTNKLLAKNARAICVAYRETENFFPKDKIILTGNPVRKDLLANTLSKADAKRKFGLDPERPVVLFVGGSLGALTINRSVENALPKLREAGLQIIWQTGKSFAPTAMKAAEGDSSIHATAFITDMAAAYAAADLVVARAGAGTISELELLGKPSVLVPSPNVAEDHQTKNAMALSTRDAAVLVPDCDAPATLGETVVDLCSHPEKLASMSENITKLALRDSDSKIADEVVKILDE